MRSLATRQGSAPCGDQGIALPLIALLLTVIMGMAALVIDLGHGWQTRRGLIPATDSAALAAAQDFATPAVGAGIPCGTTAPAYVGLNKPAATMTACVPFNYNSTQGRVSVTATQPVETWFAPVIGLGDYSVSSTSTAVWGPPEAVTGLRPIGLCVDGSAQLRDLVDHPPSGPVDITITYGKSQPNACGTTPGNWGILDLAGHNNGNPPLHDWLEDGYPSPVAVENHVVTSCAGPEPHCRAGNTGALSNAHPITSAMDDLISSRIYFATPIFNFVENPGSNAQFHLMGVLRTRLLDYKVTGNQADRTLTFRVLPGLVTGICCGSPGPAGGNKVISICGVDPNAFAACAP